MLKVLCVLKTKELEERLTPALPSSPEQHTPTQVSGADPNKREKNNDTPAMSYDKRLGMVASTKGHSSVIVPKVLSPPPLC